MLDLKHVKTFLTVNECGSFSKAADRLDLAQPTVSLHIKSLERNLGYLLFDRVGKRIVISPEGQSFTTPAREMVRLATEALRPVTADAPLTGDLNICIVQSICTYKMPKILAQYQQKYPGVSLKITVNRPSTYMLEQLRSGEFDCSIVLEAPFDIPSLASRSLWSDSLEVVSRVDHPLAQVKSIKIDSLAAEQFVFPDNGAHYRRLFERRLQERNVVPKIALEVDNIEAIKRSVIAGMGLAVLPRYAVERELLDQQLVVLPLDWRKLTVNAQLIWYKDKLMSDPAQAFIGMMSSL